MLKDRWSPAVTVDKALRQLRVVLFLLESLGFDFPLEFECGDMAVIHEYTVRQLSVNCRSIFPGIPPLVCVEVP